MICVTGGTGLLGSHLLVDLCQKNERIRAVYRSEAKRDRLKKIFQYYLKNNWSSAFSKIEWHQGSILDLSFLSEFISGCSHVYHCAGLVSFDKKDYTRLIKINREGTANIVNVCLEQNVSKLCHVSSTAAIGGNDHELLNEKIKWKKGPHTAGYSVSKYAAEKEVWRGIEEGLDAVIVNPCVIFGAGNWNESSLTIFKTINRRIRFYPPGANAVVDARDVSEIMIRLMASEAKSERYLCIGSNQNFKALMEEIAVQMKVKPPTILAKRYQVQIVLNFYTFFTFFSRKKRSITKETVQSLFSTKSYDNSKVKTELDFQFRNLEEMVSNSIKGRLN